MLKDEIEKKNINFFKRKLLESTWVNMSILQLRS
jgi:hypothetical protein